MQFLKTFLKTFHNMTRDDNNGDMTPMGPCQYAEYLFLHWTHVKWLLASITWSDVHLGRLSPREYVEWPGAKIAASQTFILFFVNI